MLAEFAFEMPPHRQRATANHEVSVGDYRQCVGAWLRTPPVVDLRCRVGGKYVSDFRAVTPGMISACSSLLLSLFQIGLRSAVVQPAKFEDAVRAGLSASIALAGKDSPDDVAHWFACHVQHMLTLLRAFSTEDAVANNLRKWPKSGGYRHKMTVEDHKIMADLIKEVDVVASSPAPSPRPSKLQWDPDEVDDSGFPTMFAGPSFEMVAVAVVVADLSPELCQ